MVVGSRTTSVSSPLGETFTCPSPPTGAVPTKNSGCLAIHPASFSSIASKSLPTALPPRAGHEGGGRHAGEVAALPGEVGLVGVAGDGGESGEVRGGAVQIPSTAGRPGGPGDEAAEAQDALERLGP